MFLGHELSILGFGPLVKLAHSGVVLALRQAMGREQPVKVVYHALYAAFNLLLGHLAVPSVCQHHCCVPIVAPDCGKTTMHILFDMDGTLTDARREIDPEFKDFLQGFCQRWRCSIVTGSDYQKVYDQLGTDLCKAFHKIFACNGNTEYVGNRLKWWSAAHHWQLTPQQRKILEGHVAKSKFWLRMGNHIEQRIGCANFSIVGRNANTEERAQYSFYDKCKGEREKLRLKLINRAAFKGLDIVLGGETGLDIYPRGHNKAQVRERLEGHVLFIGDRCAPGGNDFEIAMACDEFYQVRNWQETAALIKNWETSGHLAR